jgi:hypothetical protein
VIRDPVPIVPTFGRACPAHARPNSELQPPRCSWGWGIYSQLGAIEGHGLRNRGCGVALATAAVAPLAWPARSKAGQHLGRLPSGSPLRDPRPGNAPLHHYS